MRSTFLLLLLLVSTGCPGGGGGPCSSPEVLFPSPSVMSTTTDAGVLVDVTWTATSAPASFYASPMVRGDVRLVDAGVTGVRVRSDSTTTLIEFDLRYREGATRTCRHLGMDDTYVLSVTVPRLPDGGLGTGTVTTDVELGAL